MEDVPAPKDSAPQDPVPPDHTMPSRYNESSKKYSEETDTYHPLPKLLEQFQQLKDQFTQLKSYTHPPTHTPKLKQLTDKLQHLSMMLQPYPNPQPNEESIQKLCRHTQTPCVPQRERKTSP